MDNRRWWVLGDRAQTPSGPGYALENRQIVSRVYPELAKEMGLGQQRKKAVAKAAAPSAMVSGPFKGRAKKNG